MHLQDAPAPTPSLRSSVPGVTAWSKPIGAGMAGYGSTASADVPSPRPVARRRHQRLGLLERPMRMSLEDVFLSLTTEES
jgi:hypothetical protein